MIYPDSAGKIKQAGIMRNGKWRNCRSSDRQHAIGITSQAIIDCCCGSPPEQCFKWVYQLALNLGTNICSEIQSWNANVIYIRTREAKQITIFLADQWYGKIHQLRKFCIIYRS